MPQTVPFTFDEASHAYHALEPYRMRVPSVTQTLTAGKLVDFSMVRADILEEKSRLGTAVHLACEYYDAGTLDQFDIHPKVQPYLDAYIKFRRERHFELEGMEQQQVALINGMPLGMKPDRRGRMDGRPFVLELKSSSSVGRWWGLQLAGYGLGLPELTDALYYDRMAVQLKPNGTYNLHPFDDPGDYDCFQWTLAQTWWKLNNGYKLED